MRTTVNTISTPVEATGPLARAEWSGYLTTACADAVATRLTDMLDGKTTTVVYANLDFIETRPPDVRTSQRIKVSTINGYGRKGVHINEPGWTHTLEADTANQSIARSRPPRDRPPHLKITHDRVEITDYAPSGARYYIVIALEWRDDEDENPNGD